MTVQRSLSSALVQALESAHNEHSPGYFRPNRLSFGEGPGGLGRNSSTSERLNKIFPPMDKVLQRPLCTSLAIAWRLTPRSFAASDWEIHWLASNFF